jgi:putative IMPACT (imprinted ancient) family translation regulator
VNNELENMEIAAIDAEINRLKKSKARYLKLFEGYKLSDTKAFVDRVSEIEAQLKIIENKKLEICKAALAYNAKEFSDVYFDELKDRLSALEPELLKQAAASLVKSIEAYKNEINVVLYL